MYDIVNKVTWELGIAGKMHPTEFLDMLAQKLKQGITDKARNFWAPINSKFIKLRYSRDI